MKNLLNLIFIFISLTVFSQTQNPILELEQTYGGSGYDGIRVYDNDVVNGDFENWTGGGADNWYIDGGDIIIAQNTTTVQSGASSCEVTWTTISTRKLTSEPFVVTSGDEINANFWVYDNDAVGRARLCIMYENGSSYYGEYSEDMDAWQQISYTSVVPYGATSAEFQIRFYDTQNWDGDATVIVDNASYTVFHSPTNITLSNSNVDENLPIGTEVGILTTTDPDPDDTHSYSFVSGEGDTDNNSFTISNDELLTDEIFDYETQSSFSVRIQTYDGNWGTFSKSFTITINDVNDIPTDITLSSSTVDENLPVGSEVGIFSSTDEDTGDTHTYSFVSGEGDTDNDRFTISNDELLTDEIFDYETQSSFSVRVQTDDGNGGTFSKSFTITINDVNDIPTDITLSSSTVDENLSVGSEVGTFSSTDEDTGDPHTYSFVSGEGDTDNDSFNITNDNLLTDEIFDYETQSYFSVRVQTDDGNGGTFSKSFIITINNINDMVITNTTYGNPYCLDDTIGSIEIEVGEYISPISFLWSSGHTTQNIYNVNSGNYSVTITDGEGMVLNEQFYLEPLPIFEGTNICYLTSEGSFNVVYIDKGSDNYNVESYIVYREGSNVGVYETIGEINSVDNHFTDTTINNNSRSYSYKVSMIDKCSNESTSSPHHSTIHLSINSGTSNEVNLYWSHYLGITTPSYSIYRKYLDEDFVLLEEISSNNNTFTDFPTELNSLYEYYISFDIENTCDTIINKKLNEFIEIKSNYVSLDGTVDINEFYNEKVKTYPNPVKDKLFVNLENVEISVDKLVLFSSTGKLVFSTEGMQLESTIIEIPTLKYTTGLYNLNLYTKQGVIQRKIVIVR